MKGEDRTNREKIWDSGQESWGQVCVRCSLSSLLSHRKCHPLRGGAEMGLRKWACTEQPLWRVAVVNLERVQGVPQARCLAEVRLPGFLEDKLIEACVFPPHLKYFDYRCKKTSIPGFIQFGKWANGWGGRSSGQSRCYWVGWTGQTLEDSLAEKEAGWNPPTQTFNGENPLSIHQKCFHHLCLKIT